MRVFRGQQAQGARCVVLLTLTGCADIIGANFFSDARVSGSDGGAAASGGAGGVGGPRGEAGSEPGAGGSGGWAGAGGVGIGGAAGAGGRSSAVGGDGLGGTGEGGVGVGGFGGATSAGAGGVGGIGGGSTATCDTTTVGAATSKAVQGISAGGNHTCVWYTDFTAFCWGENSYGELDGNSAGPQGNCGPGGTGKCSPSPISLGVTGVTQVDPSDDFLCALRGDAGSVVQCRGRNDLGQLGRGTCDGNASGTGVQCTGGACSGQLTNISYIAIGGGHGCARPIGSGTALRCWGSNVEGQLGYSPEAGDVCGGGSSSNKASLISIPATNLGNSLLMTSGATHSCVRSQFGSVRCWGNNTLDQLGTSAVDPFWVETSAGVALENVGVPFAGANHTCGVKLSGPIVCWGDNSHGQLGYSSGATSAYATQVASPITVDLSSPNAPAAGVAAGGSHTCAVRSSDRRAYCWGNNDAGQLGRGAVSVGGIDVEPVLGLPDLNVEAVAAGENHSCAWLEEAGGADYIYCWGDNQWGQLGTGAIQALPVACPAQADLN